MPNVAVAELASAKGIEQVPGSPYWLVGQMLWRNLQLPLISFEALNGAAKPSLEKAHVVVLNALGGRAQLKFLGLISQGIPRSVKVDNSLKSVALDLAPFESEAVAIGDEVARIPDLLALEQALADAGII